MVSIKKSLKPNSGFTLIELLVVLAIMGALLAMAVPLFASKGATDRVALTEQRLAAVATAIIGPANTFDAAGQRVIGGYVRDMRDLPELHQLTWDNLNLRWNIATGTRVVTGTGQPLVLWDANSSRKLATGIEWKNWRGPYIFRPQDDAPHDAARRGLDWNDPAERAQFERLQTDGRLADAWGQGLYFIEEIASGSQFIASGSSFIATGPRVEKSKRSLLIVSAGSDRDIVLPVFGAAYDENAPENEDNITLRILPHEWLSGGVSSAEWTPVQRQEADRIRSNLTNALLGPPTVFDSNGRRIVGGYIGDMGAWSELYQWDATDNVWTTTGVVLIASGVVMQPRALWTNTPGAGGTADLSGVTIATGSIGWRGPYLSKPSGMGENEVLRDMWGHPLRFWYDHQNIATGAQVLTVHSVGWDGIFGTGDDQTIKTINKIDQWIASGMTVQGKVYNTGTANNIDNVEVRLWITSGTQVVKIATGPITVATGVKLKFTLPINDIPAGMRRIEVATGSTIYGYTTIFVSACGIQSPSNLEIKISTP